LEVAPQAGIAVEQRGLLLVAQRPEARAVCEAFLATDMAEGSAWLDRDAAAAQLSPMRPARLEGALASTIDIRVESRLAIPALAAWLAARHGVEFRRGTAVHAVETGRIETTAGVVRAPAIVVCPGDDLFTLFPDVMAAAGVTRCKLQMLRVASPGFRLPATIMSDLGLVRYLGYSALPEAMALRERLEQEQAAQLANGVHLIVAQSADGSLIVGDSHHYAPTPDPFATSEIDQLILDEFLAVFGALPPVLERWTGTYASAAGHSIAAAPLPGVRVVTVTSGTGASTSFALAEEVIGDLVDRKVEITV
jgi:FAD dependent oxidoreductase TIGR03364